MLSRKEMLDVLYSREDWTSAQYLADIFRVSTRTIRSTVARINEQTPEPIIESSHRGYRLLPVARYDGSDSSAQTAISPSAVSPTERRDWLLRRLLAQNGAASIYDISDELHFSDSTVQADLYRVRSFIKPYGLTLTRYRDMVSLEGDELDKRRLINRLISNQGVDGFAILAHERLSLEGDDIRRLVEIVQEELTTQRITCNDFGLNNIVMHLSTMINRIMRGQGIPETEFTAPDTGSFRASCSICERVARQYGMVISAGEQSYLSLVISLNGREETPFARWGDAALMDAISDDMELARSVTEELERVYSLEPFDAQFIKRLALHFHDLASRLKAGAPMKNPLTRKTKDGYPLIYDMAVFISECFSRATELVLNEDEITFLAFHIGGFFENNLLDEYDRVTCSLLYMNYNDSQVVTINRIADRFGGRVSIVDVMPVLGCDPSLLRSDIVLSPIPIEGLRYGELVLLDPIPSEKDMERTARAVENALARKRERRTTMILQRLLRPELFKREFYCEDRGQMIRSLVDECVELDLCDDAFLDDVMKRETLSPTAFGKRVAVPHSLSEFAHHSFLSIVINSRPMTWGDQSVNIVLLMGFSESGRNEFKTLFIDLMRVLNDTVNVSRLMESANSEDFIELVSNMIMERHKR